MYKCPYCEIEYKSLNEFNSHKCVVNNMSLAIMYPPLYGNDSEFRKINDSFISMIQEKYKKTDELINNDPKEGVKHDSGKPKLSMVPSALLRGAARALEFGANKYGRDNYKLGMDWTKPLDALERHTREFMDKKDIDDESKLCHLDHMAANIGMLLYYYENKVGKDDR